MRRELHGHHNVGKDQLADVAPEALSRVSHPATRRVPAGTLRHDAETLIPS
jgi:hypothetical protein